MISPLPSEPELLRRSAKGDAGAFGMLVTHYQDAIFNLALRMVANREDASDVAQDVFLRAFRKIRAFEGRSSFMTWLYSIAMNESISLRRRKAAGSRKRELQMSVLDGRDADAMYDPPGHAAAPDDGLERAETCRQVEQALAELDENYRSVVVLRDVEGLNYASIGGVLGCSVGTVKSRLHRARLELRLKLGRLLAQ